MYTQIKIKNSILKKIAIDVRFFFFNDIQI